MRRRCKRKRNPTSKALPNLHAEAACGSRTRQPLRSVDLNQDPSEGGETSLAVYARSVAELHPDLFSCLQMNRSLHSVPRVTVRLERLVLSIGKRQRLVSSLHDGQLAA